MHIFFPTWCFKADLFELLCSELEKCVEIYLQITVIFGRSFFNQRIQCDYAVFVCTVSLQWLKSNKSPDESSILDNTKPNHSCTKTKKLRTSQKRNTNTVNRHTAICPIIYPSPSKTTINPKPTRTSLVWLNESIYKHLNLCYL